MSDAVDIDALEVLARAATTGLWMPYETVQADNYVTTGGGLLTGTIICGPTYEKTNTHFIAAASPDVVLALIAELKAARGVVAEEPEWEYGFTSKWGTIAARSEPDAERRAQDLILSIEQGRESGDLEYHGRVMKRAPESKPGPWVLVKQEGAEG